MEFARLLFRSPASTRRPTHTTLLTRQVTCVKCGNAKASGPACGDLVRDLNISPCLLLDVVVAWRLDRLGRSLLHLIETVNLLHERGVQLRSLTENLIDTTSPSGKLVFGIFALMAEFERDQLRQRTMAGLIAARKRARVGGRPKSLGPDEIKKAKALLASGEYTKAEVAAELGTSRHTLWRALA